MATETIIRISPPGLDNDELLEHLCSRENEDRSLCGLDISDEPWNHGGPPCEACKAIAMGRMN